MQSNTTSFKASGRIKVDISSRLDFLKNGFKTYVVSGRLPMSAETKWTLEVVCINEDPQIPENYLQMNIPSTDKARLYITNYLWSVANNININKQKWIDIMKNK
jgi:hypothetical protein